MRNNFTANEKRQNLNSLSIIKVKTEQLNQQYLELEKIFKPNLKCVSNKDTAEWLTVRDSTLQMLKDIQQDLSKLGYDFSPAEDTKQGTQSKDKQEDSTSPLDVFSTLHETIDLGDSFTELLDIVADIIAKLVTDESDFGVKMGAFAHKTRDRFLALLAELHRVVHFKGGCNIPSQLPQNQICVKPLDTQVNATEIFTLAVDLHSGDYLNKLVDIQNELRCKALPSLKEDDNPLGVIMTTSRLSGFIDATISSLEALTEQMSTYVNIIEL